METGRRFKCHKKIGSKFLLQSRVNILSVGGFFGNTARVLFLSEGRSYEGLTRAHAIKIVEER